MASAAWAGTSPVAEAQDNPWMLRARVIGVLPDESGTLKVGGTKLPGDVDIGDQYVPEFDITYFFNKHIAAELILGVTPHDVKAVNVTKLRNLPSPCLPGVCPSEPRVISAFASMTAG